MGKDRLSWLCRDEQARERLLDMDRRLRGARSAALGVLAIALVAVGHWEGWWTLAVLTIAFAGFAATAPFVHRVSHPEYVMAGAWVLSSVAIAVSVALTGGPTSPAASWLAIPAVTLAARFDGRGVAAGLALLVVLMVASTLGVDPGAVADRPALLILPLAVLMAATLLTTPLMSSDREHRSESVLDGLTGMLNRRSLAARAAELDEQAALTGQSIGVIVADLDHFKAVNDEHGHQKRRRRPRRRRLHAAQGAARVRPRLPPGRRGVPRPAPRRDARRRRAAGRAPARGRESTPAGGLHVTMSFGVASASGADARNAELLARADAALYAAKHAGRNRVAARPDLARPLVTA